MIVGFLVALGAAGASRAADLPPRSIMVIDQASFRGPFYYQVFQALRSTVNASPGPRVSIQLENLDLTQFNGPAYEESLRAHFRVKYADRPAGVVVAIGTASLEYVLRWRSEIWPGVPVVYALVEEAAAVRLRPSPDVTGSVMKLKLGDMMMAARAVVPDLKRVAIVGDPLEQQIIYRHFVEAIPIDAADVEVIDLTGLPMDELRKRVAVLPDHTAILYTNIVTDGRGIQYPPAEAVNRVTEVANRPVVVSFDTFFGRGAVGGFVVTPSSVGETAARLAMRILDGESASSIPTVAQSVRPIFDWRQLQRWNVSESHLPEGSEIRFRVPSVWEQYRWAIVAIAAVFALGSALIVGLLYERRRRQKAQIEARQRMLELTHLNRRSTVGELSASIVHELNQPLGAILSNAEAAEALLDSPSLDPVEIKAILADIKLGERRANEVIEGLRRLLKNGELEVQDVDLNETVGEVLEFLTVQASTHDVTLNRLLAPEAPRISGNRTQLQQVLLNLIVNGMESIAAAPNGRREVTSRILLNGASAEVSIADSGPGIPSDKLKQVFEPFFTTKDNGMGMGLSIARTIVEAHGGRIWAENQSGGGAVFRLSLPLAKAH